MLLSLTLLSVKRGLKEDYYYSLIIFNHHLFLTLANSFSVMFSLSSQPTSLNFVSAINNNGNNSSGIFTCLFYLHLLY